MKTVYRICAAVLSVALFSQLAVSTAFASEEEELVYSHRKNEKMMIALTFDDGPHPRYTPKILDILKKYDIKATFFEVGENVISYPDVSRRCLDEGHEIANHTFSHMNLSNHSFEDICHEISAAENTIYENLEIRPKLLRPPGGLYGINVMRAAAELDYTIVLWNIDTRDWAHTPAAAISKKVLENIKPGDIILMHDYIGKNSPTPDALRQMIPILLKRGYKFVTVSELLGSK